MGHFDPFTELHLSENEDNLIKIRKIPYLEPNDAACLDDARHRKFSNLQGIS